MAKGNLFQGMARGKVGDVVFSRLNGEQVSRVRNRHPKNPRTNAQLYQRAIMATIMQAYSAGKEIFDHSFQDKRVGEDNMRVFMSRNIKMLRGVIANEVDTKVPIKEEKGRVVAPGAITPVPVNGLIVSQGTVYQNYFKVSAATEAAEASIATPAVASADEKLADYAARVGLYTGDIYTFVAFKVDFNDVRFQLIDKTSDYATQYAAKFGFLRLIVKDNVPDMTAASATLNDIFNIECDGEVFVVGMATQKLVQTALTFDTLFDDPNAQGQFAIIRSREDSGVRSTEQMQPMKVENEYGIASWFALEAWQRGTTDLGNSELLLEGGGAGESAPGNSADTQGGNSSGSGSGNQGGGELPPGVGGN